MQGFRSPYLEDSPETRAALYDLGFRYDSTIGARGGANRQWPATMEHGVPYDCSQGGQSCARGESYPGMWEVPLYATGGNSMDYCTDESTGEPRPGCSAFNVLKRQFDEGYRSNRAPMQILIHTPYLQKRSVRCAVRWRGGQEHLAGPAGAAGAGRGHAAAAGGWVGMASMPASMLGP